MLMFLLYILWCFLMIAVGIALGAGTVRDDAIDAGHAEYYLDENNKRRWRWKEGE